MIRIEVSRSQFYSENTHDENKRYFDLVNQKFLHNIDTFYFNCFINDDYNDNPAVEPLIEKLDIVKKIVKDTNEIQEFSNGLYLTLKRYKIYEYCLSIKDRFDIFISDYLPNDKTPRIVVQLRSIALWLEGYENLILSVYDTLTNLLNDYNITISRTLENRADYCYHTNIIQNPHKQFSDSKLERELFTNLTVYQKIGKVQNKNLFGNKLTLDYFGLGERRSNNTFVRCYNKTREVIEEGYKAIFFDIWYKNNMINFYDKYCLEFAYKKGNYESIHEGRLLFYIEYGKDDRVKNEIYLLLNNKDTRLEDIKILANSIMPPVTIVMNIEFQTKRKFYYYADSQINLLPINNINCPKPLHRVFQILDNRKLFLDYLTEDTLSFKKSDGTFSNWWKRLRGLKIDSLVSDEKYLRSYSKELNYGKVLHKVRNGIGTLASIKGKKDSSFIEDVSDMLSELNDNDMKRQIIIIEDTGKLLEDMNSTQLKDYKVYKEKKSKNL